MKTLSLLLLSFSVALARPLLSPDVAEDTVLTQKSQSPLLDDLPLLQSKLVVKAEPEVKVERKVKVEPKVMVEPEVKVVPEVKVEPEVKVVPEVKVEPEVKVKPEVKVEQEVQVEPELKAEPEVKVEPQVKVEPEVKAEPEVKEMPPLPATRTQYCPGVVYWGKCYQFFPEPKRAVDAELFCQRFPDGHLASITSYYIHREVVNMMLSNSRSRTWIGGIRLYESEYFVWLDGSSWGYADWLAGEPNNTSDLEDCVELLQLGNGKFNDFTCWEPQSFVCSYTLY